MNKYAQHYIYYYNQALQKLAEPDYKPGIMQRPNPNNIGLKDSGMMQVPDKTVAEKGMTSTVSTEMGNAVSDYFDRMKKLPSQGQSGSGVSNNQGAGTQKQVTPAPTPAPTPRREYQYPNTPYSPNR